MKNKKALVALLALTCMFAAFAAACNGNSEQSSNESQSSNELQSDSGINSEAPAGKEERYTLTYLSYDLEVNEDFTLGFDDGTLASDVTWASSDESIVTVDEAGKVMAKKVGVATIKAENSLFYSLCTVTVTDNGILPTLTLNVQDGSLTMTEGTFDILPTFMFNKKSYKDVTYTYETSDATVASVENGTITALQPGNAVITVTAAWRNAEAVVETIAVEVLDDAYIFVDKQNISLFSSNPEGKNFATSDSIVVKFMDGDKEKTVDLTIEEIVESGAEQGEVAVYENGVFSSVAKGQTQFKFTCEYMGLVYESDIITVEVCSPVISLKNELLLNYDETEGVTVELGDIGVSYTALTSIIDEKGKFISIDASLQIPASEVATGEYSWLLYFDNLDIAYEVPVIIADRIIRDSEDFALMEATGYYVLANDIDLSSLAYAKFLQLSDGTKYSWYSGDGQDMTGKLKDEGFNGTLDGRGYVIKNISNIVYGVFGIVGANGVIKNVGFENFSGGDTLQTVIAAQFLGTLENVSFYSTQAIWSPIALAINAKFINVVSYVPVSTSNSLYQQLVLGENRTFENVYVVSNKGLGKVAYNGNISAYDIHYYASLDNEDLGKVNFGELFALSESSMWRMNALVGMPFITKDESIASVCTVTFTDGMNILATVKVTPGQAVIGAPTTEAGYEYAWTKDGETFDITTPITEDVTLVGTKVLKTLSIDASSFMQANGQRADASRYAIERNKVVADDTAIFYMGYNPNAWSEVYAQWKFNATLEDIALWKSLGYTKITFKVYVATLNGAPTITLYGTTTALTNKGWTTVELSLDTLEANYNYFFQIYLGSYSYGFAAGISQPIFS